MKLWIGQSVSLFGSQITVLALPLTAVLLLRATPLQMGILGAAFTAPLLPFGLLAGVWIDGRRRWPVMIVADLGRAVLLASVPLSAMLGSLRIELLYAVAFGMGLLTLVFEVAYQAYMPSLVPPDDLVEGNSKLQTTSALAQVAGPEVGGALIQIVTAPVAILLDSASFVVSLVSLLLIGNREEAPPARASSGVISQVWEGIALLLRDRLLRAIIITTALFNVSVAASTAIYVLYVARELSMPAALIGLILTLGGVGGLLGAVAATRLARRYGIYGALVTSAAMAVTGLALTPLALPPRWLTVTMLALAQLVLSAAITNWNINQLSLRQRVTPVNLQGRVHATFRLVVRGTMPLGMLVGGVLGSSVGLRPTLAVAAGGGLVAAVTAVLALAPGRAREEAVPGASTS
jgi:MFS family permease